MMEAGHCVILRRIISDIHKAALALNFQACKSSLHRIYVCDLGIQFISKIYKQP